MGVALLVSIMPLGLGPTRALALAQPSTRCDNVRRVRGITFDGSPLFDDVTLLASIATQAPTFAARTLHLKALPCSDSLSVRLDARGFKHRDVVVGIPCRVHAIAQAPQGAHSFFLAVLLAQAVPRNISLFINNKIVTKNTRAAQLLHERSGKFLKGIRQNEHLPF